MAIATKTATAADDATTGAAFSGLINISIQNLGEGLVLMERSYDTGSTWIPMRAYNYNVEDEYEAPAGTIHYRLRLVDFKRLGTGGALLKIGN